MQRDHLRAENARHQDLKYQVSIVNLLGYSCCTYDDHASALMLILK